MLDLLAMGWNSPYGGPAVNQTPYLATSRPYFQAVERWRGWLGRAFRCCEHKTSGTEGCELRVRFQHILITVKKTLLFLESCRSRAHTLEAQLALRDIALQQPGSLVNNFCLSLPS